MPACIRSIVVTAVAAAACRTTRPLELPTPPATRPAPEICVGQPIPVQARGLVVDDTGARLPDVAIVRFDPTSELWSEIGRTGADGTFRVELPGPAAIGVGPWRSTPLSRCVGVPNEAVLAPPPPGAAVKMVFQGNDFASPRLCDWHLTLPGADGDARIVLFRSGDRAEIDAVAHDGRIDVRAPCDLVAVAVYADKVVSAPAPGCDAPPGAACVPTASPDAARNVPLAAAEATTISVIANQTDNAVLTDGMRRAPVDDHVTWTVAADARLRVDTRGKDPAGIDLATGNTARGSYDGRHFRVDGSAP